MIYAAQVLGENAVLHFGAVTTKNDFRKKHQMELKEKLLGIPRRPGVYLMKGTKGEVLYVGKAKVLANRVRSYFLSGRDASSKIQSLVTRISDIETMVTASELEALILENNLIKRHRPKYNVVLRDDKNYPLLRLPIHDPYPRLEKVRRIKKDGALYFGPYVPGGGLQEIMRLLRRIFPIPNCTIEIDGKLDRPCIEFEIKRCLAPCTGNQSQSDYNKMIGQIRLFLEGKDKVLLKDLKRLMEKRAALLDFEEAARLRDQIAKIERALEKQRITSSKMENHDVIAMARKEGSADIQILFIRGGMVIGRKDFFFENISETPDEALCAGFIQQFYNKEGLIPRKIMIPLPLTEIPLLEEWLTDRRGGSVSLVVPQRGKGKNLIQLAKENADVALLNHLNIKDGGEKQVKCLQDFLHLTKPPHRIEGYDISNIMGTHAVGSMVVFEGGKAKKSDYRHFQIKTIEGANDFAMMAEMLTRRIQVLKTDSEASGVNPKPDLILIDGGKGQIGPVYEILKENDLFDIDLIGLAKERGEKVERVFLPKQSKPIELPVGSPVAHLLMQVRDEAHRFAISYHRKIRNKAMLSTPLQEIKGIGPVRRSALLKHFGSLSKIRLATCNELAIAPSMNQQCAKKLFDALHSETQ